MNYKTVELDEQPYLYVAGTAPMDPAAISGAMGQAFATLMAFISAHRVTPLGPPMAVYHDYDPKEMRFRAAMPVVSGDLDKAEGEVGADKLPAGRATHFTHTGPYAELGAAYEAAEKSGVRLGIPTWEVYVNDPAETPEAELRTEVYSVLA